MKLNLYNTNIIGRINRGKEFSETGVIEMGKNINFDEFMKNIISKIRESSTALDADRFLYDLSKSSEDFKAIENLVKYKYKDFNIMTCLDYVGEPIIKNLKKLNSLNISVAPELIGVINKDKKLYIITRKSGMQNGDLNVYFVDGVRKVSQDSKLKAYEDLQKLTKAGLVDEQNLRGKSWYYTSENEIFLPNWENLRQIRPDESQKDIVEQYYKIIFRR